MDTQRLIAFIVFSFSLLLLWEAWQKEHQAPQPTSVAARPAADQQVPVPTLAPGSAAVPATAEIIKGAVGLPKGTRIKVTTDTLVAEIDTLGGDIRRLSLLKHRDAIDEKKILVLFDEQPGSEYVAQSGLIGSGLPTHKSVFQASQQDYALASGANEIKAMLTWISQDGALKVAKIFTFHRDSYVVDVAYEINNNSTAVLQPHSYFQLLRTGNPPVGGPKFVATYTGAAVYTEKGKFQKVDFADIEKGKAEFAKQGDDGWVAILQHYLDRKSVV